MDQRRARRYEIRLPVEVVRAGAHRVSAPGETCNVSSGGVLFTHLAMPVEVGQPVEYLIDLPTGPHLGGVRLRCLGTVVRRDENSQALAATLERYEFIRGRS
ncbi:MAG: PilZ domain-containing protein [Bryobacteraceae bacterium]|nr:PilZ domain-containing protein [Bryobacteraceae bacterium]